ncbi:hypothetical protein HDU98_002838 [Podochytrium sp. JEL0797]|nr:hypothetical protein HDU98_002838 [Podochytrium sp. JEL0797]
MDTDSDRSSIVVMRRRSFPNVLITGTPGTGKTTTAAMIAQAIPGMKHIEVGKVVKEKALHDGFDEEFNSYLINEDRVGGRADAVVDELEDLMQEGGNIVDHHGCDFFPERWFDLVVVLRASNEVLYPRLQGRGYNEKKITENIDCEIMDIVKQEAAESYDEDVVVELQSNSLEDMEENVQRIETWIGNWRENNAI